MTKLTHNLGMKVIACFFVIIAGFMTVGSGAGAYYAYTNGFYGNHAKAYHESDLCRSVTRNYKNGLITSIDYGDWVYGDGEYYASENTNFRYVLKNEKGYEMLTNCSKNENIVPVGEYNFVLSNQYVTNIDGKIEVTPLTTPMNVTLEGYILEPPVISDNYTQSYWLHQKIYDIHNILLPVFGTSLLICALCFVFLLCAAGHKAEKEEIILNLQDKIPLDLYLALTCGISLVIGLIVLDGNSFNRTDSIVVGMIGLLIIAILALATILTCATRIKLGRFFYQNTILYRLFRLFARGTQAFFHGLRSVPLARRVALGWIILSLLYLNGGIIAAILSIILLFLFCISASQMQKLAEGGEALAKGNLRSKIDTQGMFSPFRRHGEHLNSVSKGFSIALNQKMKSERLKTELITNVSHDIKTPLTSIINYVDLLKKEALTGQAAEYVEVLDRQSRRLKKLTEDLVEASKASTGNIKANLAPTDMGELVAQAVAEYEEKLELAKLEVIVTASEEPIYAMADGNLTWRVLSNLLSNACKYSQAGTRVYIDLQKEPSFVTVSMKNISKDALNIPVEELMERFVRGDSSRHTEGSGLGLNIAQSLVNLQKGKFSLEIEGDLFKAFMKFPATEPSEEQKNDTP